MFNTNTSKIGSLGLVLVLMITAIGVGAGGVAAQDSSTVLVDDSTAIDSDTESVYVDVTGADDMNGSGPVNVTVSVVGVNSTAGTNSSLDSSTISVAAGSVESYSLSLTDANRDEYDSVEVTAEVVTAGEEEHIASTDWGTTARLAGGGGALGSVGSVPILGLLVVAGGGYYLMGRD